MHTLLRLVSRLSHALNALAQWALMLCGMGMVAVIGLQVFFRYVLNDSLFWSEELGRMLLVWLTFLGASVAYRRGAHIGVDILSASLPRTPRRVVGVISHLVCLAFFALVAYHGFRFLDLLKFQSTTSLGVSRQVPFIMVPVGAALMFLHGLAFLLEDLIGGDDR
ncbi:TRAP-type C4-dicarboxylate transport system permease small subunit [Desulfobaculum xiamenense]|uniref:TRAP-type C4-dicarboxylate transport system permease small subunit n=1 Tax=Desulfobaculum xiamenense TaxID=995050 RepID=A0A846QN30_9BACT|nr:TRAP transporter small permease [Desulfobaculum xiamenense]NJB67663.1 TRAP-type C4-dicarboxylate transport system permease small subunit [Desulfobaculum xiamenense]